MIYQDDWLLRQIDTLVQMMSRLLLGRPFERYVLREDQENDRKVELHLDIMELLHQGRVNEAENRLFERLETQRQADDLAIALDFYAMLNTFSDEELARANFSRQEIDQGLHDIARLFGVPAE